MIENAPYNYDYRYQSEHRRHRWEQPNFDETIQVKKDLGKKTISPKPLRKRRKTKVKTLPDKLFFYRFNVPDQLKLQSDEYVKYRNGMFKYSGSFYV